MAEPTATPLPRIVRPPPSTFYSSSARSATATPTAAEPRRPAGRTGRPGWVLVAGGQCVLVATRADLDPVELEVWVGEPATPPPGPPLYEGELRTTGQGVEVGDLVAGDGHQVQLPIGWHRLRIYADQPGDASRLRIVFDPAPDRPS